MSTNPNNAVGTNGAYGGRTSVDAFNDVVNVFNGAGILSGWQCSPSSGMTVQLGGVTGSRDVAVATAPGGSRTTVNNRTSNPISVTLDTAPATNSRIDVIVAYVANPPQGSSTVTDNPAACGIIAVKGTSSSSPTAPTDSDIRTAITADGATGSTAYYVVLATISVVANVTTITSNYITQGTKVTIGTDNLANSSVTSSKIDFTTLLPNIRVWYDTKFAGSTYYMPSTKTYPVTFDISSVPDGWTVIGFFSGWCRAGVEKGVAYSIDTDAWAGKDYWENEPGTQRTHAFSCSEAFQKTAGMTQIKCSIRCDSGDFTTSDGRFSFTAIALPSNLGSGTIN